MVTVMFDLLMANADVFAWGYNAFVKAQEEVRMHLVAHNPRQGCSPVAAAEQLSSTHGQCRAVARVPLLQPCCMFGLWQ